MFHTNPDDHPPDPTATASIAPAINLGSHKLTLFVDCWRHHSSHLDFQHFLAIYVSQFVIGSYLLVWHVQISRNTSKIFEMPNMCEVSAVASPLKALVLCSSPHGPPRIYPSGTLFRLLRLARTTSSDLEPQAMAASWHSMKIPGFSPCQIWVNHGKSTGNPEFGIEKKWFELLFSHKLIHRLGHHQME